MTRSGMKFIKGMGLGLLAGTAAGITMCCCLKSHKRGFKRRMSRALRNMGELVDNVNGMF